MGLLIEGHPRSNQMSGKAGPGRAAAAADNGPCLRTKLQQIVTQSVRIPTEAYAHLVEPPERMQYGVALNAPAGRAQRGGIDPVASRLNGVLVRYRA
ncbi:hypothetical protein SAMN05446635_0454 [Burkholderia sp. OK233]|nr:hypothetical protein SAMN05446635_0454 [Burkholderia sp. OK233]